MAQHRKESCGKHKKFNCAGSSLAKEEAYFGVKNMLEEKTIGHKPCLPEVVGNESPQGYTSSKADNMLQRSEALSVCC